MNPETTETHAHAALAEEDRPKNLVIVAAIVVCTVGFVAIVIGVDQYYKFFVRDQITQRQLAPESTQLRQSRLAGEQKLARYQWVDREKGVVRIPVERAMELTLRDWAARPGNAPAPAEAPAGAPGGTQAPAPAPAPK